nr:FAD-dependent oxidoreductase [Rhizobium leguminosarum]
MLSRTRLLHGADGRWVARGRNRRTRRACRSLDPRRTAMIRDGVKMLLPAAGEGSDEWLGFRPSMPDSLPAIGSSRHLPRVTYAFGHGHLGLTLSALTGYLVSQLVAGQCPAVDLTPLRPDRF